MTSAGKCPQRERVGHEDQELKVARIGNSRGVRLPASSLKRYAVGAELVMEERAEGILLDPKGPASRSCPGKEPPGRWPGAARIGANRTRSTARAWIPFPGKIPERGGSPRGEPAIRPGSVPRRPFSGATRSLGRPDPSRGSEMAKTRPVVIVSLDELNRRLQTVTVCPITSELHRPGGPGCPSGAPGRPAESAVDQIRTISKTRLQEKLGALSERVAPPSAVSSRMFGD